MTISYTGDVANARLCAFSRLLLRWKGSIYKLLYKEMIIFCFLYALLSVIYRLALTESQKRVFEKVALHCETFVNLIPLSFVLGFYVAIVVGRWWSQFMHIPWPDRIGHYITTMIEGNDDQGRMLRRTLMRYMTLGGLIVFQATSIRIKKRFPTMEHLIEAGIATKAEALAIDEISTPHGKWWIPFVWCSNLIKEARKQGRIQDNYLFKTLIDELNKYRGDLGMLYAYDWISIPLVYTQVTTLAVYIFFLGSIFGRQFLDPEQKYEGHEIDLYVPVFTILQFFFYMGWLKVAEQLINPFGEDDDDYELSWVIDRNWQISLLVADDLHGKFPGLVKDPYFGEPPPDYLPYTKSSVKGMSLPHMGSTADIRISDEGMKVLTTLETIKEGVALGGQSHMPSYFGTPRRISTPTSSPKPIRFLNQNLMSGSVLSPDVLSHASLQSCHDSEVGGENRLAPPLYQRSSSRTQHNIFARATEKLSNWLMHHSSRMDLNPTTPGGSIFAGGGLTSRQFSTSQVDDRESLQSMCGDSINDLRQDGYRLDSKGFGNMTPRLSPVAEMLCSKSAPVGVGEHFFTNRFGLDGGRNKIRRSGAGEGEDLGESGASPGPIPSTSAERRQQEQSLLRQCLNLQQQQQLIQNELLQNQIRLAAVGASEDRSGTPRVSRRSRGGGHISLGVGGGAFVPVSPSGGRTGTSMDVGENSKEFKIDECIEMNLKEFNNDFEADINDNGTCVAIINATDQTDYSAAITSQVETPTSAKEVHWSKNLEQIHEEGGSAADLSVSKNLEQAKPAVYYETKNETGIPSYSNNNAFECKNHIDSSTNEGIVAAVQPPKDFRESYSTKHDSHINAGFECGDNGSSVNGSVSERMSDSVATTMTEVGISDDSMNSGPGSSDDLSKSKWSSNVDTDDVTTKSSWASNAVANDSWSASNATNSTEQYSHKSRFSSSTVNSTEQSGAASGDGASPPWCSTADNVQQPWDIRSSSDGVQLSYSNANSVSGKNQQPFSVNSSCDNVEQPWSTSNTLNDSSSSWQTDLEYQPPDLHQCTVTSLTPLLADEDDNDINDGTTEESKNSSGC